MMTPLRAERLRRRLTAQQVADFVGVSQGHIARIEKNQVKASTGVAQKLALCLGNSVTRDQILYPEDYEEMVKKKYPAEPLLPLLEAS